MSNAGASYLYTALKRAKLRKLVLDRNNISGGSFLVLRDVLRGNAAIETLHMNNCNLGPSDLSSIAEGLQSNKVLLVLSVHHNYVQSAGVKAISVALAGG